MTLFGPKAQRIVRVCAPSAELKASARELFRGGVLMLLRWFVVIPFTYLSYNIRGLSRSPWRLKSDYALGAGIIVANHPSAFFDLVLCLAAAPKWTFFLHEFSRTRVPLFNSWVRLLRGVPVLRTEGRDSLYVSPGSNVVESRVKTANTLSAKLAEGHWVTVFPEGRSSEHSHNELRPLREGVARLALATAASTGWSKPLRVFPVGFIYEDARYIGTDCTVRWGQVIDVLEFKDAYMKDEEAAVAQLLTKIKSELEGAIHCPEKTYEHYSPRGTKERVYDVIYFFLLKSLAFLGLPFRLFGRLAAHRPSEQAAYATSLWLMCLAIGSYVGEWRFVIVFAVWSVICTRAYVVLRRRRARL